MIKNEYCCSNQELKNVLSDLKNNKEFGSLFQFWVSQILSELSSEFKVTYPESKEVVITYDNLHKLAIKIVNRLGQ